MSDDALHMLQERFERQLTSVLLQRGMAARNLLEEAFGLQVVMGGDLSTNLWDLGFTEMANLEALCADLLHVPVATMAQLARVDPSIIQSVPQKLAQRAMALPFGGDHQSVFVATSTPWNLPALEEIAFRTGKRVSVYFANEIRIIRALHQHYAVPLTARVELGPQTPPSAQQEDEEQPSTVVDADLMSEAEFDALYTPSVVELPDTEIPVIDLVEVVDEAETLVPIASMAEATAALGEARNRDEVGLVLTRFAMSRGKRVVLLVRHGRLWTGWTGAGDGVEDESVAGMVLPMESGTMFGLVGDTAAPFLGPLTDHWLHGLFLRTLGPARPRTVGFFPVHYRGKIAFGIYLDGGDGGVTSPEVGDILLLAQKVALTLERIVKARLSR